MLLALGNRGNQVAELQRLLNSQPSNLPKLVADGVSGLKTKARVAEFQRSNGLAPDGIVGDKTLAKLQGGGGEPTQPINLLGLVNDLSGLLQPVQRSLFVGQANSLVPRSAIVGGGTLANAGAIPIVIIALFIIILFMIALTAQSQNPTTQQMGREWARRFARLKEQIRGKPIEVQTAKTLEETQQMGKDVVENAKAERQKCLDRLSPEKLAKCENALRKLSEAIQSLILAVRQGVVIGGRGSNEAGVIARIGRAAQAVFEASREAAQCTGCDNMVL